MNHVWILAADTARARYFRARGKEDSLLEEFEDLVNPATRFPEHELVTDTQGRTGNREHRHAYGEGHAKRDSEREDFARTVMRRLEEHRAAGELTRFYIIAEHGFLGLLRAHMSHVLSRHLAGEIARESTRETAKALRELLPREL